MKFLAFGEVLWDIYPEEKYIGGAPFNFAAHAARMGVSSYLCSAVGRDALSEETLSAVKKEGVQTDFITRSDKKTGQCLVTLDEKNIPSYNLLPDVAYDDIDFCKIPFEADVLYFGTLALRSEKNEKTLLAMLAEGRYKVVFADLNIRPPFSKKEAVCFAAKRATVLKISEEELPTSLRFLDIEECAYREAAKKIARKYQNLGLVLITRGEKGAFAYDKKNDACYEVPAVSTETVSTVGAGDSFSAAFLTHYLSYGNLSEALAFASRIAAFVVSQVGAVPAYNAKDFY